MSRRTRFDWLAPRRRTHRRSTSREFSAAPYSRRLRIEPLEDRRLLSITVNTLIDEFDGVGVGTGTSLREAVFAVTPGDTINFSVTGTINLSNLGEILVNKSVTINGPGAELLTIKAYDPTPLAKNGDGGRLFEINDSGSTFIASSQVVLSGLTLTGGDVGNFEGGGAINNAEHLAVVDCVIADNSAATSGGAIQSFVGNVSISNSTIANNVAVLGDGGGIFMLGDVLTISGSSLVNNVAGRDGGAIFVAFNELTISDSTFIDNESSGEGGAIAILGAEVAITSSQIAANIASGNGGAIAALVQSSGEPAPSNVDIADSRINDNSARGYGGAIHQPFGTLDISRSRIAGNGVTPIADRPGHGGAIFSSGSVVSISESTFAENVATGGGGAIYTHDANLTVISSTLDANSAGMAGGAMRIGIGSGRTALVSNSTISGNFAGTSAGGIHFLTYGGATVSVEHSTIALNIADSDNNGTGNTGGLRQDGPDAIILDHSIIAKNDDLTNQYEDLLGNFAAQFSLIGGGIIDPLLGPLANNGGLTFTHALLAGSPAIDAGNPGAMGGVGGVPQFDQRGLLFSRIAGGRIDIGAYERQSLAQALVVDSLGDGIDGNIGPGQLTLREAIELANGNVGADVITFASTLISDEPATILLTEGQLAIRDALTINGPGEALLTIDASGNDPTPGIDDGNGSRVFFINGVAVGTSMDVEIADLELTGGDAGGDGGAIANREDLTLTNCTITGNSGAFGGGIANLGGSLTIVGSAISGNSATYNGGGIYSYGQLSLSNCTISSNDAEGDGGGIQSFGNPIVTSSTINDNGAGGEGGGIRSYGQLTLTDCTVGDNRAASNGGGIRSNGQLSPINCTISGNVAQYVVGGIASSGNSSVTNSTISGNSAAGQFGRGGGVYIFDGGTASISHSTITGNSAPTGMGSGIASSGGTYFETEIHSSIIAGNLNSDVDFVNNATTSFQSNGYNLIGTGNVLGEFVETGDQINIINPMLAGLAVNGGPTRTHALLAGSPAVDAGDPAAMGGVGGVPEFDQRGVLFSRVVGGRIDIGAFELQPTPSGPALPGDYNQDNSVDVADYVVWRKTLGTVGVPPFSGADGSGNGTVGPEDYGVWRAHFGLTLPGAGGGAGAVALVAESTAPAIQPAALPMGEAVREVTPRNEANVFAAPIHRPADPAEFHIQVAGKPTVRLRPQASAPSFVATQQDDALLTWLGARIIDESHDDISRIGIPNDASPAEDDADLSLDALDTVFETLAIKPRPLVAGTALQR